MSPHPSNLKEQHTSYTNLFWIAGRKNYYLIVPAKDQGKVARCLAKNQYGNGSAWQCTGLNLRFKNWRFIHRACLNLLPLNANKARYSNAHPTCRHCTQPKTLGHVVCHCRPLMMQIRWRHNAIVNRLTKAVRFGKITTDRTIKGSNLNLRPDIVVEEDQRVFVMDEMCPFDNDEDALLTAALAKINKYLPLKHYVESWLVFFNAVGH